jgi:hypothetical protein
MITRTLAHVLIATCLAAPALAQQGNGADNPLESARELYAAARYDEALAVLDSLRSSDRRSIEQYRSLCLLALGRAPEAEAAIGAVVKADPRFQPSEADASPRVRAAFTDVRRRLLPEIATARYGAAKAAYDRKEWKAAEQQFRDVVSLLEDPDMNGRLVDLRTLASGFMDLAAAAAAPPPEPPKPAAPPPAVTPPPAPRPDPNRVYSSEDPGVVPPSVVRQDVPPVPANITAQTRERGRIEVVIDEQGRVISAMMRLSIHAFYDQLVMSASREWRYKPATLNGVPVKYRRNIGIAVSR